MTGTRARSGPPHKLVRLASTERVEHGKAVRKVVPRASQAAWTPSPERVSPLDLLVAQEATRVQELVPLRRERMLASPFSFYRGAAIVMASDLGSMPSSGLSVQCCGDAHLANFGGFASPQRVLVFDMNDFDETNPGPFEWDVKRLATSFEIAARHKNLPRKAAREVALACVGAYRRAMTGFAAMSTLRVWYAQLDVGSLIVNARRRLAGAELRRLDRGVARAETRDSMRAFDRLVRRVDGELRIASDPPVVVRATDLVADADQAEFAEWLEQLFAAYKQSLQPDRRHLANDYRLVDVARKVVGVGSVGTRSWIALLMSHDDADPLFLQIKEAQASVLEPPCGPSEFTNHGQRVVEGQRLLQSSSDILLGWLRSPGVDGVERDYYVRQLWDWKVSVDVDALSTPALHVYAEACGWTLARGHARSGDRIAIAAYLGSGDGFDRAIASFAGAYADQNEVDYQAMVAATAAERTDAMVALSSR